MTAIKIAIHHHKGSFSDKWIEYCQKNSIQYKLVDCYASTIIDDLKDYDVLMWHWHHNDYKAILFARQLIYSLELMGKKVFPNSATVWYFDDKVGQKYLLEAVNVPIVKSYVFYDDKEALRWSEKTQYPIVVKLRGGAGASNVKLMHNYSEATKYIEKAFKQGFGINRFNPLKERIWKFKRDKNLESFINILKGIGRVLVPNEKLSRLPVEKNYLYAQDFAPNNDSDIRVIVIGTRAFAIKRMVRENDFRASGSGNIVYDPKQIPLECVLIAFETNKKIRSQCTAYDFVFLEGKPLIIEVGYGFDQRGYLQCPGYWDENLNWIDGKFTPEYFMIEDMLG